MRRRLITILVLLATFGSLVVTSDAGAAVSKSQLRSKVLSISNMPVGWVAASFPGFTKSSCNLEPKLPAGDLQVKVAYLDGQEPGVSEVLGTGPNISSWYKLVLAHLEACKTVTGGSGSGKFTGTGGEMSFPAMGSASKAFAFNFTAYGTAIGLDGVVFERENTSGQSP